MGDELGAENDSFGVSLFRVPDLFRNDTFGGWLDKLCSV